MADILSFESSDGLRCVGVVVREDLSSGLKEFRREPEDGGRSMLVADLTGLGYATRDEASRVARARLAWQQEGEGR